MREYISKWHDATTLSQTHSDLIINIFNPNVCSICQSLNENGKSKATNTWWVQ